MRRLLPAALASSIVLLATACLPEPSGPLAEGSALEKTCPKTPLASSMHVDISGTFASESLGTEARAALMDMAARTAVCNGTLRVSAFSGTSAQTITLFDERLSLPGATGNARYRRIDETVEHVVTATTRAYARAVKKDSVGGTDVVGQLRLAAELGQQVAPNATLDVVVLTDGLQSVARQSTKIKSTQQATKFADELPVPRIWGSLVFAGLGNRSDGSVVSSATVELLKSFYARICQRTGADPCAAVTSYQAKTGADS